MFILCHMNIPVFKSLNILRNPVDFVVSLPELLQTLKSTYVVNHLQYWLLANTNVDADQLGKGLHCLLFGQPFLVGLANQREKIIDYLNYQSCHFDW